MGSYRIEWRRSTKRDLRKIPQDQVSKIVQAVEHLGTNPRPHGCSKLSGSECAYRIRVGDYRIIYEIYDGRLIVEVVKVGHRRDIYR